MAYRSWLVIAPNEAKITENMLACLQATSGRHVRARIKRRNVATRWGNQIGVYMCISRSDKTPLQRAAPPHHWKTDVSQEWYSH